MDGSNFIPSLLYKLDGFKDGGKGYSTVNSVGHVFISNGPTWSLDGTKFYHVCSIENKIKEYDYHKGEIQNPRIILEMNEQIGGGFDGSTMDA